MKVRPTADYPVSVIRQEWEELPETAALYRGIFEVALNHEVRVSFVPDVSRLAPPWDERGLPTDLDQVETAEQARLATALFASYVVTPNQARAGTQERFPAPVDGDPELTGLACYVTPEEFESYTADLEQLLESGRQSPASPRVSQLRDHEVIRFLEQRVVASTGFDPDDAVLLGQPR